MRCQASNARPTKRISNHFFLGPVEFIDWTRNQKITSGTKWPPPRSEERLASRHLAPGRDDLEPNGVKSTRTDKINVSRSTCSEAPAVSACPGIRAAARSIHTRSTSFSLS